MEIDNGPFNVPEFALGHWTHPEGRTGCTVVLAHDLVPAAVDVRGAAPGTRETDLLAPGRIVQRVDAVLMTGGSAFGLAAADGIMRWLREHGRGFPTTAIPVPIVTGAVIFDLDADNPIWPDADAGYLAADSATPEWLSGRFGGGTGARVSKGHGRQSSIRSGIGVAQVTVPAGTISAVFVVNAVGDIVDDATGELITWPAGATTSTEEALLQRASSGSNRENTVVGTIVCSRPLDPDALTRLTVAAHSGLARVTRPAHTPSDGDTVFALSSGLGPVSTSELMQLSVATQVVSARAIVNSVAHLRRHGAGES
jgi:L-aminopeptidase/D-esterase-like protein